MTPPTAPPRLHPAFEAIAPLAAFMRAVTADPALQARLDGFIRFEDFAAQAAQIANALGIALTAQTVLDALQPGPATAGLRDAPLRLDSAPGPGWLPAIAAERGQEAGAAPQFDWLRLTQADLDRPFFYDAAASALRRPFNRLFRTRTPLAAMQAGAPSEAAAPDGLILHMSRCGSTLAAQMLAASPRNAVLSEPGPLDAALRWAVTSGADAGAGRDALRAVAAALGRARPSPDGRVFIKLDCWHSPALPLLRAAFPDTPWIFLYRTPEEVLVSHMRNRGVQTVPGQPPQQLLGEDFGDQAAVEEYCARVLARICGALLEHWNVGGGMLVEYSQLPGAMQRRIPAHFGFAPDAGEAAAMHAATARNAKLPDAGFAPDGADKRAAASDAVRNAAKAHLWPLYEQLEGLRARQDAGA